jgi:hypothetical protein
VKVCLFNSRIYQCTACCCLIPIGVLCCDPVDVLGNKILYPYGTALDQSQGWWFGLVITNIGDTAGTAKITYYENDGDVATGEVPVEAHRMAVLADTDLLAALTPSVAGATLGNSPFYILIESEDMAMTGFAMMGNGIGASMGYTTVPFILE